jgi:hypothetical protein
VPLPNAFLNAFIPASEQIDRLLEGPMTELDNQTKGLQAEFSKISNPSEADVKALGFFSSFRNLVWKKVTQANRIIV